MIQSVLFELASKGYLLDSDRKLDQPIQIYKGIIQIFSENIFFILVTLSILVLIFFVFLYLKRKEIAKPTKSIEETIDPYEEAIQQIKILQNQNPSPSAKPFVFRLSEILRVYVERAFNVPAMELTGEEFMREIASHTFFKNRFDQTIQEFVLQGDRIKYSNDTTDDNQMTELLNTALSIVEESHQKVTEEKFESLSKK